MVCIVYCSSLECQLLKAGIFILFADAFEPLRGVPAYNKHALNGSWMNENMNKIYRWNIRKIYRWKVFIPRERGQEDLSGRVSKMNLDNMNRI